MCVLWLVLGILQSNRCASFAFSLISRSSRNFAYSHDICAPVAFYAPVPVASGAPGTCGTAAVSAVPGSSSAARETERERERACLS